MVNKINSSEKHKGFIINIMPSFLLCTLENIRALLVFMCISINCAEPCGQMTIFTSNRATGLDFNIKLIIHFYLSQ